MCVRVCLCVRLCVDGWNGCMLDWRFQKEFNRGSEGFLIEVHRIGKANIYVRLCTRFTLQYEFHYNQICSKGILFSGSQSKSIIRNIIRVRYVRVYT